MALPLAAWAAIAGGAAIATLIGKKIYDKVTEDSSSPIPEVTIFLTGESGVGKDTILHILKDGKFKKSHKPTPNLENESFITCDKRLCVINTSGAEDNDEENIEARRRLFEELKKMADEENMEARKKLKYVYVFRADDYLKNPKVKKQVDLDLDSHKHICEKNKCTFKIIGTHKDKCLECDKAKIQKLPDELGEKGKFQCQILDLTQFNGKEKQQELCDFITD